MKLWSFAWPLSARLGRLAEKVPRVRGFFSSPLATYASLPRPPPKPEVHIFSSSVSQTVCSFPRVHSSGNEVEAYSVPPRETNRSYYIIIILLLALFLLFQQLLVIYLYFYYYYYWTTLSLLLLLLLTPRQPVRLLCTVTK